jgi:predicted MPP superfamily phosphohydrolase
VKKKNKQWIVAGLATAALGLLADAMFFEKYFFQIKHFDIGNKGSGKSIKLVLLTDLHFRSILWPYYRRLARKVNQLQPDLVLITGDSLDSSGRTPPMNHFFDLLDQGVQKVAIPGNHDHKADNDLSSIKKVYKNHNCDFLVNESKAYLLDGERVMITGLDDFIEGESRFAEAVKEVGEEKFHILLVHSPLQQEMVRDKIRKINEERDPSNQLNISYIFAGHNHGGQIRLPGWVPVLPVKSGDYVDGWYNKSSPYLYVSKGFGTSTVPFRFGARAEVTVFNYYV